MKKPISIFLFVVSMFIFAGINMAHADTIKFNSSSFPSNGVKKTSNTQEIKKLQTFLNWNQTDLIPLVVDGKFGSKTISAIKKYQSVNSLTADGLFGSKSANKANQILVNGEGNNALTPVFVSKDTSINLIPTNTNQDITMIPSGASPHFIIKKKIGLDNVMYYYDVFYTNNYLNGDISYNSTEKNQMMNFGMSSSSFIKAFRENINEAIDKNGSALVSKFGDAPVKYNSYVLHNPAK